MLQGALMGSTMNLNAAAGQQQQQHASVHLARTHTTVSGVTAQGYPHQHLTLAQLLEQAELGRTITSGAEFYHYQTHAAADFKRVTSSSTGVTRPTDTLTNIISRTPSQDSPVEAETAASTVGTAAAAAEQVPGTEQQKCSVASTGQVTPAGAGHNEVKTAADGSLTPVHTKAGARSARSTPAASVSAQSVTASAPAAGRSVELVTAVGSQVKHRVCKAGSRDAASAAAAHATACEQPAVAAGNASRRPKQATGQVVATAAAAGGGGDGAADCNQPATAATNASKQIKQAAGKAAATHAVVCGSSGDAACKEPVGAVAKAGPKIKQAANHSSRSSTKQQCSSVSDNASDQQGRGKQEVRKNPHVPKPKQPQRSNSKRQRRPTISHEADHHDPATHSKRHASAAVMTKQESCEGKEAGHQVGHIDHQPMPQPQPQPQPQVDSKRDHSADHTHTFAELAMCDDLSDILLDDDLFNFDDQEQQQPLPDQLQPLPDQLQHSAGVTREGSAFSSNSFVDIWDDITAAAADSAAAAAAVRSTADAAALYSKQAGWELEQLLSVDSLLL